MNSMTGAELIIKLLERQGIDTIAGIPGGANLPLYDALSQSKSIRHILSRHEQGAGFMAQGMARVSGNPAVCFATSGPGATNILTAIADAKLDSIPVVCITGQVASSLIGTDAFQEVDTYGMTVPITKHNYLVRSAAELLEVIPQAFSIAASGRPGPVLIDVPKDIQNEVIEFEAWPEPGTREAIEAIDDASIDAAIEMIHAAERPVLYVGGGIIHSEAAELLQSFTEKAGLPTTTTLMGLGVLPSDHPLNIGMLGMHAARYTNKILERSDLLIALGVRFDDRATGKVSEFCPEAKVVHVDIDTSELDKIRTAHIGITGDAADFIKRALPRIEDNSRTEWLAEIESLKEAFPMEMAGSDDAGNAYGIIRHAGKVLPDYSRIATDVGQHQMKVAQAFPFKKPRTWLTSGGLGTMGFGLPAAIGASLADPDNPSITFSGDGSFFMNLQELAVAAEHDLNVKVVLLDNQSLGLVHQQQDLFYGKRIFASTFSKGTDFCGIAEAFGVKAVRLGNSEDPTADLEAALLEKGPCLIHVPIDVNDKVFPMVPPGAGNHTMLVADEL